jgi:hypothetical protein
VCTFPTAASPTSVLLPLFCSTGRAFKAWVVFNCCILELYPPAWWVLHCRLEGGGSADVACVGTQGFHDPFSVRYLVPLGGSLAGSSAAEAEEVNTPYRAE